MILSLDTIYVRKNLSRGTYREPKSDKERERGKRYTPKSRVQKTERSDIHTEMRGEKNTHDS